MSVNSRLGHLDHKSKESILEAENSEVSANKETVDIDIYIESRNGEKKVM